MIDVPGYKIIKNIYESSHSLVFRGIRNHDEKAVVLKILRKEYPTPRELKNYQNEYDIVSNIHIDGVIRAYGIEKHKNSVMIVFEDFGAQSLRTEFRLKPFGLQSFLDIAIRVTKILGEIHAAQIIHKDINLSNIVVNTETGRIAIIDFGISTLLSREHPSVKNPEILEGTLAYISPEQTGRMNRSLDYRTDFYSFGVVLYELSTGRLPFDTNDPAELVYWHIAKMPIPPHDVKTDIPKPVSAIIMKLLSKNAEDRYQSVYGILTDLMTCANRLKDGGEIGDFAIAQGDLSDRFQIPPKLYGRFGEIDILLGAFARVAGKTGKPEIRQPRSEVILVSGYSGIGKTSLIREIYKPLTLEKGYFVSGKFEELQRNVPYSGIIRAFANLIKQILSESEKNLGKWREQLLAALGPNGRIITDVIPELALIIGEQPTVPELNSKQSQNRFHLVFQNFMDVFVVPGRILVMFLDDLQWADTASLDLLERTMANKNRNLLFIGAYRDNEVDAAHPLMLSIGEIEKSGTVITDICLTPLNPEDVCRLVSDTLHCASEFAKPLAEILIGKTGGNPFFIKELIKSLYDDMRIIFDHREGAWKWSLEEIRLVDISQNVVHLMANRIQKLNREIQDVLKLAACVGNRFELGLLSHLTMKSVPFLNTLLREAITEGLVIPVHDMPTKEYGLVSEAFKFSHDRIQQAAYSLIEKDDKASAHLMIGRMLLVKLSPELQNEKIFDIVNHLNRGIELTDDDHERRQLARLNLAAGIKAKDAAAYAQAFAYFNTGMGLAGDECWQDEYETALNLWSRAAESAFLCSRFDDMERLIEIVLKNGHTVLDKIRVHETRIISRMAHNTPLEAIRLAFSLLDQLGVSLPKNPNKLHVIFSLMDIRRKLKGKSADDFADLPEMGDPRNLAVIRIVGNIASAAYLAAPELFVLIVLKAVKMSVKDGFASFTPFAFAGYAMLQSGILGKIDSGNEYGRLASDLGKNPSSREFEARVTFVVNSFVRHWKEHIGETLAPLLRGYRVGLENGDLEFASFCVLYYCVHSYYAGKELSSLERECAVYTDAVERLNQKTIFNYVSQVRQIVLNLTGHSDNPILLCGESYDERAMMPVHEQANDIPAMWTLYSHKMILCYLFRDTANALENAIAGEKHLIGARGRVGYAIFHYYDSLVRLAACESVENCGKKIVLRRVAANLKKIRKWAAHAPMNWLHKQVLIEAERARVLKQYEVAAKKYNKAISLANKHEYLNDEALALELTARFYFGNGQSRIGRAYLRDAHYAYRRWGASAKTDDLEKAYPEYLSKTKNKPALTTITTREETVSQDVDSHLDIKALMKASHALSGEIILADLLRKMMRIVIENSGAQKACFIMEEGGRFFIEANTEADSAEPSILKSVPVDSQATQNMIPVSIVNYVARTKENIVLDDAFEENRFSNDRYVTENQTKSVLCSPIVSGGKLTGILYLENSLVGGVFTPKRVEMMRMLSAQLAISVENARFYKSVRESEEKYRSLYEKAVEGIFQTSPDGMLIEANPALAKMMGCATPEEVVTFFPNILRHIFSDPGDRRKFFRNLAKEGKIAGFETRLSRKDGKTAWASLSARTVRDEDGMVIRHEGLLVDITARVAHEKAERKREIAEAVNTKILESIRYAERIQHSLLPDMEEIGKKLPKSFFIWMPRDIVGGDLYHIEFFGDAFLAAVIDCTGHGVPGGFMTMIASSGLKKIIREEGCRNPSEILSRLNLFVKTTLRQDSPQSTSDDGLDAGVCYVKPLEKTLVFSGAKLPLYYVDNGKEAFIRGERQSLGYRRSDTDFAFANHTIEFGEGASFYMYTDGFPDQIGVKSNRSLGKRHLRDLLRNVANLPFDTQRDQLIQAFEEHRGGHERVDDVTVVGFGI